MLFDRHLGVEEHACGDKDRDCCNSRNKLLPWCLFGIDTECSHASTGTSKQLPNVKDLLPNIFVQSFDTPLETDGEPGGPKRRNLWRQLLQELSSLPRSISVLGIIAFLSSLGTIIEQGEVSSKVATCGFISFL